MSFLPLPLSLTLVCPCRLRLSPSPPPTKMTGSRSSASGVLSHSAHCSTNSTPAKRRRPNDTDSEASSMGGGSVARTRITQQASASGRVTVDEVDLDGKYVRLSNKSDEVRGEFMFGWFIIMNSAYFGDTFRNICWPFQSNHQDQNLGNWQLKRQVGSGAPIIFKFPVKFTLKAGQRVAVRNTFTQKNHKSVQW